MSMSDCEKCWETPCVCGYDYGNYTKEERLKLAASVLGVGKDQLEEVLGDMLPETHPDAGDRWWMHTPK